MSSVPRASLINEDPSKKCPKVLSGSFDPALLREIFEAWDDYAEQASISASKIVGRVSKSIQDPVVIRWLRSDKERITKLPLDSFKKELRALVLEVDWEIHVVRDIRNCRQQSSETFMAFYYHTPSELNDDAIRSHLRACMTDPLILLYEEDLVSLNAIASFDAWLKAVDAVDKKRTKADKQRDEADKQRDEAFAAFLAKQLAYAPSKRARDDDNAHHGSKKPRTNENQKPGASTSTDSFRPNKLTDTERELIIANFGCLKCRRLFVWHRGSDGVCDFPSKPTKPITERTVAAAKAHLTDEQRARVAAAPAKKNGPPKAGSSKAPVAAAFARAAPAAAVMADYMSDDESAESSDSEESDLATRGVRSDATTPSTADEDTVLHPHSAPSDAHFFFDCLIEVMIDADLVEHVGLPKRRLHKPISFDLAVSSDPSSPLPPSATEYVKLRLHSRDQSYSTKPVRAVVVSGLCAPIILGIPFLSRNRIIIDHFRRTAVDDCCKYDLLNPIPITPRVQKKRKTPRESRKEILTQRKLLATELRGVCEARRDRLEAAGLFEYGKPVDPVAAVRERILVLAEIERLRE
ncbi:hypothetical protein C8F01DRAFT_1091584 [Mycena amicta]|nr:hypothetical protein C8F01DRAFT_1091584 [Mycena amicta]